MKPILKFIFNFLRNTSLIIVIGIIGVIVYFEINEKASNRLIASMEKNLISENQYFQHGVENRENYFHLQDVKEVPLNQNPLKKIKFKVKNGNAYVRASQIMYVKSGQPIELITINKDTIVINSNLTETAELLNGNLSERFFRIKSAIINCSYIQQLVKESNKYNEKYTYQYVLIMEDGERIPISDKKAKKLFRILDDLSFDNNI